MKNSPAQTPRHVNYDFLLSFLSTDVYLYHFINFTKRKTFELLTPFGHFTDCCWMILGWIDQPSNFILNDLESFDIEIDKKIEAK